MNNTNINNDYNNDNDGYIALVEKWMGPDFVHKEIIDKNRGIYIRDNRNICNPPVYKIEINRLKSDLFSDDEIKKFIKKIKNYARKYIPEIDIKTTNSYKEYGNLFQIGICEEKYMDRDSIWGDLYRYAVSIHPDKRWRK